MCVHAHDVHSVSTLPSKLLRFHVRLCQRKWLGSTSHMTGDVATSWKVLGMQELMFSSFMPGKPVMDEACDGQMVAFKQVVNGCVNIYEQLSQSFSNDHSTSKSF